MRARTSSPSTSSQMLTMLLMTLRPVPQQPRLPNAAAAVLRAARIRRRGVLPLQRVQLRQPPRESADVRARRRRRTPMRSRSQSDLEAGLPKLNLHLKKPQQAEMLLSRASRRSEADLPKRQRPNSALCSISMPSTVHMCSLLGFLS